MILLMLRIIEVDTSASGSGLPGGRLNIIKPSCMLHAP
jgi:hypothetical protein